MKVPSSSIFQTSSEYLYKSVRSKLLTAHQDVNENPSKVFTIEGHGKSGKVDQPVIGTGSSVSLNLSERVKIENEDSDHVDSDITVEDNKEYINESGKFGGDDVNEVKGKKRSHREISRKRISSPVAYNTRK